MKGYYIYTIFFLVVTTHIDITRMPFEQYTAVAYPSSGLTAEFYIARRFNHMTGFQSLAQFMKHVHLAKFREYTMGINTAAKYIHDHHGPTIRAYTLTPVKIGRLWYMSETDGDYLVSLCVPPRIQTVVPLRIQLVVPPPIQPVVPPRIQLVVAPRIQPVVPPRIQPVVPPRIQLVVPPRIQPVVPPRIQPVVPPPIQPVVPPRRQPVVLPDPIVLREDFVPWHQRVVEQELPEPDIARELRVIRENGRANGQANRGNFWVLGPAGREEWQPFSIPAGYYPPE